MSTRKKRTLAQAERKIRKLEKENGQLWAGVRRQAAILSILTVGGEHAVPWDVTEWIHEVEKIVNEEGRAAPSDDDCIKIAEEAMARVHAEAAE